MDPMVSCGVEPRLAELGHVQQTSIVALHQQRRQPTTSLQRRKAVVIGWRDDRMNPSDLCLVWRVPGSTRLPNVPTSDEQRNNEDHDWDEVTENDMIT